MISRAIAAASLLTALTLSGCGGSDADPKPKEDPTASATKASEVDPAAGTTISTDDYSFNVPTGWKESEGDQGGGIEAAAFDTGDQDDFADNLNVVRKESGPIDDLNAYEDESVKELQNAKYTDVKVQTREEAAGEPVVHLTGSASQKGATFTISEYSLFHDGATYFLTFSTSVDLPTKERDDLARSVLATWKWAS